MENTIIRKKLNWVLVACLLMSSCGGGDTSGELEPLTVEYVENVLQTESSDSFELINTSLVHENGIQNKTVDLNRLVLSKVILPSSETAFSWSISIKRPHEPEPNMVVMFYVDLDNDALTGQAVEGVGAELLFLDNDVFSYDTPHIKSHYYWTGSQWASVTVSASLGFYDYQSISPDSFLLRAVYVYTDTNNISGIFSHSSVRGVLMVQKVASDDPNDILSDVDSTSMFTFSLP